MTLIYQDQGQIASQAISTFLPKTIGSWLDSFRSSDIHKLLASSLEKKGSEQFGSAIILLTLSSDKIPSNWEMVTGSLAIWSSSLIVI